MTDRASDDDECHCEECQEPPYQRQADFVGAFVAYMVAQSGGSGGTFADGSLIEDYARCVALLYWESDDERADGPEECAQADMDCWEHG